MKGSINVTTETKNVNAENALGEVTTRESWKH